MRVMAATQRACVHVSAAAVGQIVYTKSGVPVLVDADAGSSNMLPACG